MNTCQTAQPFIWEPDNGNGQWYKGQLDDVRLYKVAMSDEMCSSIMVARATLAKHRK